MDSIKVNRMILDKVEARDLPAHVKGFIREVLRHEQEGLGLDFPRYTRTFQGLLNKYAGGEAEIESGKL